MNKKNLRKGFTTVELVIVIAVIAILATALIPTFGGLIDSANNTKAMSTAREVYNDYLLKTAETSGTTDDYYIVVDGKYFEVENGKLNTKSVDLTLSEVACDTLFIEDDATNGYKTSSVKGTKHTYVNGTCSCGAAENP